MKTSPCSKNWPAPRLWYERLRRLRYHRRDVWGIGLVKAPIHRFLDGWPEDAATIWLDDPAVAYHADPFAIRIDGRTLVLTEYVPRPGVRGEIVARELGDDDRLREPTLALRLPAHLSYPFLIEQDGEHYCIPETVQANGVLLFRAIGPEPRWVFERKLIDGFAAADSTVIFHDQRYWLFCTQYILGPDNPANSHLHIWHARNLHGPWLPHARNPVKVDRSNARPAGTPFVHDGELFRPAQDCSRTYGGSVKINRISVLTETEFMEDLVAVIEPRKGGPFPDGFHHLSAFGEYTLVDGKRKMRDALKDDKDLPPLGDPEALAAALADLAK
jgi:hypothetical protein